MAEYSNEKSGVLFVNEKKPKGSSQPDYRGTCEIEGVTYELAGWKKVAKKSGKTFLSIKFSIPRDTVQEAVDANRKPAQTSQPEPEESDPF